MRQCGHQVREFKSHFRFRGFGTVYQLYGTNRLGLGTAEPCVEVCLHSESVEGKAACRSVTFWGVSKIKKYFSSGIAGEPSFLPG